MRKVVLRMNEDFKYSLIKKLIDLNGNKKHIALHLNVPFTPKRTYPFG